MITLNRMNKLAFHEEFSLKMPFISIFILFLYDRHCYIVYINILQLVIDWFG